MSSSAKAHQVLEIHLISAQGLKPPSTPRRRFRTYALTWIDSATKLRTRVDKIGGLNPTWNDKFLFRVTPEFLESETSGISIAIYAVGTFKDHLIGTVRFLISNIISSHADADASRAPCFTAVQIRRQSGRFHGIMNIGAMVANTSDFPALDKITAIGYRDLMGMKIQKSRKKKASPAEPESKHAAEGGSSDSCMESFEDEGSTTTSSSSSPQTSVTEAEAKAALKEWNGVRELAGNKGIVGSGFLCCLVARRDMQPLTPTKPAMER